MNDTSAEIFGEALLLAFGLITVSFLTFLLLNDTPFATYLYIVSTVLFFLFLAAELGRPGVLLYVLMFGIPVAASTIVADRWATLGIIVASLAGLVVISLLFGSTAKFIIKRK